MCETTELCRSIFVLRLTRQFLGGQSLADTHEIYAQYLETAFHQYREQSQKLVQRSVTMAQHPAETTEANAREAARTRHCVA
jgi:hypothetical protein